MLLVVQRMRLCVCFHHEHTEDDAERQVKDRPTGPDVEQRRVAGVEV